MKKNFLLYLIFILVSGYKLNAQNLLWAKQIGGIQADVARAIVVDQTGNIYTAGVFSSRTDFDPGPDSLFLQSAGFQDIYISKMDPNGNLVWADRIGGVFRDYVYSMSMDADGNIYCGGYFSDTADFDPGPGVYNLTTDSSSVGFAAKYDQNGQLIWAKAIGQRTDSTRINYVNAITNDERGNVFILGNFSGTADFDPGPEEYFLQSTANSDIFYSKLDPFGNLVWVKQIGGFDHQQAYNLKLDADHNLFICGDFTNTVDFDPGPGTFFMTSLLGNRNAFIMKTDSAGQLTWAEYFPCQDFEAINDLAFDRNGNIFLTGYFNADADFDPGPDTHLVVNGGDEDGFVCRLDPLGHFVWVIRMTGEGVQEGTDLEIHRNGDEDEIYLTGFYQADLKLDQGSGALDLQAINSSFDVFILKLSVDSLVEHSISVGGPGQDLGYAIAVGDNVVNQGIYAAGSFRSTADFDPGTGNFSLISKGSSDSYVAKFSDFSTGVFDEQKYLLSVLIYPNPVESKLNIRLNEAIHDLTVCDVNGRPINAIKSVQSPGGITLDVSALENGIYFLTFRMNGHVMSKQVIVFRN